MESFFLLSVISCQVVSPETWLHLLFTQSMDSCYNLLGTWISTGRFRYEADTEIVYTVLVV